MSEFVYHEAGETAQIRIDGKSFEIPSHELYEVPDVTGTDCNNNGPYEYRTPAAFIAAKICEHAWYLGIVQVTVKVGKGGTTLESNVEEAKLQAQQAVRAAEDKILERYVSDQRERIANT